VPKWLAKLSVVVSLAAAGIGSGCHDSGHGSSPTAWISVRPEEGGTVTVLAVSPQDPRLLLAGTHGGVFRSEDGGANWARSALELAGDELTAIRPCPSRAADVYAGTARRGVFRSTDGGATFLPASGTLPPGTPDRSVTALAVDPTSSDIVYAALEGRGVYRSDNAGLTWAAKVLGLGADRIHDLVVSSRDPKIVYAASNRGIFRSENGGDAWSGLTPVLDLTSVLEHPTVKDLLLAAGPDGVWRSTDNGGQWARFENGLRTGPQPGQGTARVIAYDPANPTDLYLSGLEGVWRARGGQNQWDELNSGLGVKDRNIAVGCFAVIAQGPFVGPKLVAGVPGEGIFASTNGGLAWQPSSRGVFAVSVRAIAVSPTNPEILYVGTPGRIRRSLNGGVTWDDASGNLVGMERAAHDLWVDPRDEQRVIAATDSGVFHTSDRGATWIPAPGASPVVALDVHRNGGDYGLVIAVGRDGVYRSQNGAASFKRVAGGGDVVNLVDVIADPTDRNYLYAVREDRGALYSRDQGATWKLATVGLAPDRGYAEIGIDVKDPARLLLSARDGGVFASADSGVTWTPSSVGLPAQAASHLAIDPRTDPAHQGRAVVVVPGFGIYFSPDSGRRWAPLLTRIFPPRVMCLTLAMGTSDHLYVGLPNGLLRSP